MRTIKRRTSDEVIGIDPSLTATGVAGSWGTKTITSRQVGIPRLAEIRDALLEICQGASLIVIEGYAFGSRTSHAHALGELGGVIRLGLHEAGLRWVDVPPSVLKKFATGSGNASKERVLAEAIRRLDYAGHDHNEADALWLWALGMHLKAKPVVQLPRTHVEALHKIEW